MPFLKELEYSPSPTNEYNEILVILSDVWLDNAKVLEKLYELFNGYETSCIKPLSFIFMGNFLSEPVALDGLCARKYKGTIGFYS